jgi:hypothetical protein
MEFNASSGVKFLPEFSYLSKNDQALPDRFLHFLILKPIYPLVGRRFSNVRCKISSRSCVLETFAIFVL